MRTILVVDDSSTIRRMVIATLQSIPDVKFEEVGNGLEAIERLAVTSVHLMLLDLNMPDMHGMELLQFLRSHPAYESLPVVILTTRGDDTSRAAALSAGATRYMTKPFNPAELIDVVKELLQGVLEKRK
ncbi:MAG: response regulator [Candidatus Thermofonsia bacterium]|nr:MAG: response regulator [Candidatus Thermofonsia bacterium]